MAPGHKYRAIETIVDGIKFPSKAEARRWIDLKLLQMAKKISDLKPHPKFELKCNGVTVCHYIGDTEYLENGRRIIEDVKGVSTPIFRLKAKLFRAQYPTIELRIYKAK